MSRQSSLSLDGSRRVVIEGVTPEIDGGLFPIKRVRGEPVVVEADVFVDGHEVISCALLFRREQDTAWREAPMEALVNDRWRGVFVAAEIGRYVYTITAWVDRFKSWRRDLGKKADAQAHTDLDMRSGALLLEDAAQRAGAEAKKLNDWAKSVSDKQQKLAKKLALALSDELVQLVDRYPDRTLATKYSKDLLVVVDRDKARFSSWYEMFPRSCAPEPGRHGTLKDCANMLPYVASMGFDVLYLPPIHPIGRTHRKGKNNAVIGSAHDPGSPWAIGAEEGGHKSLHPELGTLDDFKSLVRAGGKTRYRNRSGSGLPVQSRSSVCQGTSAVVSPASGRERPVCRKPAEKIRRYLSTRFHLGSVARTVARTIERGAVLDRPGHTHFSGR